MRFGIGLDFFINVILTILGYIPGHVRNSLTQLHNFFIQRVRDNSNKKRTPAWLKKCGLVVNPSNSVNGANRKWADRYLYVPELVQHDEEGRAYYLNPETNEFDAPTAPRSGPYQSEDESDEVVGSSDALVEPDRYYASSKPSPYYTQNLPTSTPADTDTPRRANKSLLSRTRKLFGGGGSSSASVSTMDRHSRIDLAMGASYGDPVHERRNNIGYHEYDDDQASVPPPRRNAPATAPTDTMDELDRELLGLSTQESMPPVRTSRQHAEAWDAAAYKPRGRTRRARPPVAEDSASSVGAPAEAPARERDIMEYEHTF